MTGDLPDYSALEPPAEKPPVEYSHHERRAEILRIITKRGGPSMVNQSGLAERYDVHDSTISRDMDRLRKSVDEFLGTEAKFTTRTLYQHVVEELLDEDDWRAKKAAWDVAMDFNEWLADIGEQDREPDRAEVDVDVDARRTDISYTLVREEPALPTDDGGGVDYDDLGFSQAPASVDVTAADDLAEDGNE